jgi:hypothetical protein
MAWQCPQVMVGRDGFQICSAAANTMNEQSRTENKGWFASVGVGHGANNEEHHTLYSSPNVIRVLKLRRM